MPDFFKRIYGQKNVAALAFGPNKNLLVITDFGELDCYEAQFIVGNNTLTYNILILQQISA